MKSKKEKLEDEKAMKWAKSQMSGLARAIDDKHDDAVKRANARVRELHNQGLLILADNGKIMHGRDGEQKIRFSKNDMSKFGNAERQYKAAIKEAKIALEITEEAEAV
jgi:hypothetical protein